MERRTKDGDGDDDRCRTGEAKLGARDMETDSGWTGLEAWRWGAVGGQSWAMGWGKRGGWIFSVGTLAYLTLPFPLRLLSGFAAFAPEPLPLALTARAAPALWLQLRDP